MLPIRILYTFLAYFKVREAVNSAFFFFSGTGTPRAIFGRIQQGSGFSQRRRRAPQGDAFWGAKEQTSISCIAF